MKIELNQLVTLRGLLERQNYIMTEENRDLMKEMSEKQYKRFLALYANNELQELENMAGQFKCFREQEECTTDRGLQQV